MTFRFLILIILCLISTYARSENIFISSNIQEIEKRNKAETKKNIKKNSYIIAIESTQKLPLYGVDTDGNFIGLYRKVFDKFARDNNITVSYMAYELSELYKRLLGGDIDFKFPDNPTWRAADKSKFNIHYSDRIYYYLEGIFVKSANQSKALDKIHSLGVIGTTTLWSLQNLITSGKIKAIRDTPENLISKLILGEIEGILSNHSVMQEVLYRTGLDSEIAPNFNLPHVDDYYYLSTKDHSDIIVKFNRWLEQNRESIHLCHQKYLYDNNYEKLKDKCIFD